MGEQWEILVERRVAFNNGLPGEVSPISAQPKIVNLKLDVTISGQRRTVTGLPSHICVRRASERLAHLYQVIHR